MGGDRDAPFSLRLRSGSGKERGSFHPPLGFFQVSVTIEGEACLLRTDGDRGNGNDNDGI